MSDNKSVPLPPEVFVDGMEGILFGYPNCKLRFTTVDPRSDEADQKSHPRLTLVIPTAVLLQTFRAVMNHIDENKQAIKVKVQEVNDEILATLDGGGPNVRVEEVKKSK